MWISMNGPTGPGFPLPPWVLVHEAAMWTLGLPGAIPDLNHPTVCSGRPCLAVFANPDEAEAFANRAGFVDVRPLPLTDLLLFIAVLTAKMSTGVSHVVRYCPDLPGDGLYECDAGELVQRLTAAAGGGRV